MGVPLDTRQSINRAALPGIGVAANTTLDSILTVIGEATYLPTASVLMTRDANANTQANNFIPGLTAISNSGGTTTLVASSSFTQVFFGTGNQTVVLPDATTLTDGQQFYISNESSGTVTINANGGGLLQTMTTDTHVLATVTNTSSGPGVWDINYTANNVLANPMTTAGDTIYGGTPIGGVAPPERLGIGSNGQFLSVISGLPAWGGGPMTTEGDIIYEGTLGVPERLPLGTAGQVLAVGSGIPAWTTPTGVQVTQDFVSSGTQTYITPTDALYLRVRMVGGGGGGGGFANTGSTGGCGGGGGAYVEHIVVGPLASTYTYSLGAGGTAGAAANTGTAGSGGNTLFSGGSLVAGGGAGGGNGPNSGTSFAVPGNGGTATGGNVTNNSGGAGYYGGFGVNTNNFFGGNGGGSFYGSGGHGGAPNVGANASAGEAYGSGGGGNGGSGTATGTAGAHGGIIIEAYYQ
jgi:hypothetical protein